MLQKPVYADLKAAGLAAQACPCASSAYKARQAGVLFLVVDPAYTSQTCPRCGLAGPSDHVAAVNVRQRARVAWALVNAPIADGGPECEVRRAASSRRSVVSG
ncbi:zinc ribbon domain-containing protein [Actinomadura kijaniata]|uniref:zinc ribbon domain-containing protein n=1 Tax=Actinomadura kijaniata TaxID=46161 RepID=UPI003F1AA8BE